MFRPQSPFFPPNGQLLKFFRRICCSTSRDGEEGQPPPALQSGYEILRILAVCAPCGCTAFAKDGRVPSTVPDRFLAGSPTPDHPSADPRVSCGISAAIVRVAISRHRLVALLDGQVTFRWRDSASPEHSFRCRVRKGTRRTREQASLTMP